MSNVPIDDFEAASVRVALLYGGWSREREVSEKSADACRLALCEAGFACVDMLDLAEKNIVSRLERGAYDVAFIAMHGAYGEDGCAQGMCEILGLPYTFSGVLASALSAEKEMAKLVYKAASIPTPPGVFVKNGQNIDVDAIIDELGLPLFVKPAADGSSYGVSRVDDASELEQAFREATQVSSCALIESAIIGTEITVPVIGNEDARALSIIEVLPGETFYDLAAKYDDPKLHHVIPARLPEATYEHAQEFAVRAHRALGCLGASRSDFIVNSEGTPIILETNTIPGMTAQSLLPDAAAHDGISLSELVTYLVKLAFEAHPYERC